MSDIEFFSERVRRLRRRLACILNSGYPGSEDSASWPSIEEADAGLRTIISAGLNRIQGTLAGIAFASTASPDVRVKFRELGRNVQHAKDLMASMPAMIVVGEHIQMHHSYVSNRLNALEGLAESLIELDESIRQIKQHSNSSTVMSFIEAAVANTALFNCTIESL